MRWVVLTLIEKKTMNVADTQYTTNGMTRSVSGAENESPVVSLHHSRFD